MKTFMTVVIYGETKRKNNKKVKHFSFIFFRLLTRQTMNGDDVKLFFLRLFMLKCQAKSTTTLELLLC